MTPEQQKPRAERLERARDQADTWIDDQQPALERAAMIEVACLMSLADEQITPEEFEHLAVTIGYITQRKVEGERVRAIVMSLVERLRDEGWAGRLTEIAQTLRDPEARRRAFRMAAAVSFVDGAIQEQEGNLFALLAEHLEIPRAEAARLLRTTRDEVFGRADPEGEELTLPVFELIPDRKRR
jgi:tellurite resistance protein